MREKKWTPGPWVVEQRARIFGRGSEVRGVKQEGAVFDWVSSVQVSNVPNWQANAHLIAAAPELVEALEELCDCISETRGKNADAALFNAKSALAKAYGEEAT